MSSFSRQKYETSRSSLFYSQLSTFVDNELASAVQHIEDHVLAGRGCIEKENALFSKIPMPEFNLSTATKCVHVTILSTMFHVQIDSLQLNLYTHFHT